MAAARAGQLKVIKRVLEISKPSLNLTDREGRTALDHAHDACKEEVVEYMMLDTSLLPFARGLLPAIARRDAKVVDELLSTPNGQLRADVNVRDARGASALHCAVRAGSEDVLRMLVDQQGVKVNVRDRYGRTPLDTAYERDMQDIA